MIRNRHIFTRKITYLYLAALILLIFIYLNNLTGWLMNDDEGWYLYQAWRISKGEFPYKDFYTTQMPLFLFTGSFIFKTFGAKVFCIRIFSVIITIFSGYLIFLIGKRIFNSYKIGLLSLISYLIMPMVYFQARLYRSDVYMAFFSILGFFLFIKAWQDKNNLFFYYSGISYAIAIFYKLTVVLGVFALVLFALYCALIERKFFLIRYALMPFLISFLGVTLFLLFIIESIAPEFFINILNSHFNQPQILGSCWMTTALQNIKKSLIPESIFRFKDTHVWILIFSLPITIQYLFNKNDIKKIFVFFTFSAIGLLLNPYPDNFGRYILYLFPISILIFISFNFYLLETRNIFIKILGLGAFIFILIRVFISGAIKNTALSFAKEDGTLFLANYVKEQTKEEDYVVVDYGEILFYAKRITTPNMAWFSEGAVNNGSITSESLIKDLNSYQVKMILIHREGKISEKLSLLFDSQFEPHHFKSLIESRDGYKFIAYLQRHYNILDTVKRGEQTFDVYVKK